MLSSLTYYLKISWTGLLNSYAQVFFSLNKVFALILMLVSFFDFEAGCCGVIAVIVSQLMAYLFNYNHTLIKDGSYTYNSLAVGIALGMFYQFNFSCLVVLLVSSMMTFFLTLWFSASMGRKGLPFLSAPFLAMLWVIILGAGNYTALELKAKDSLSLALLFPQLFSGTTSFIGKLYGANALYIYFRSLGAVFFQFNDLAGVFIAIGLLIYSRIAFILSIFGFTIGYLFYVYLEGDFSQLIYSYIGFNFILTAIALGGFFVVPSRRSFALLLFTIPIIALLISALHSLLWLKFGLPLYSLPFNIVVLLFLSAMLYRTKTSGLDLVTIQNYSPEQNHYKHLNRIERFKSNTYFHFVLPIMGDWTVSQGHGGKYTHKGEWQYAWDFDIRDDYNSTFRPHGNLVEDYYCYGIPVIAPAAGYVVKIIDSIEDNEIGKVDIERNWGNTIVIQHGDFIYSKLSHLKKNSFKVKIGDYVKRGDVVATCGSSGRSPEPHLHFQLQSAPDVGSKTVFHPISYYLSKKNGIHQLHTFDVPKEGDLVSNIQPTKSLLNAFEFVPGRIMDWRMDDGELIRWELFVNAYNQAYFYCHKTGATAYFVNDGMTFYFTEFYGSKKSLLHHFYLGLHRVLLGYYNDIEVKDRLNIESIFGTFLQSVHDLTAPFFHYETAHYAAKYSDITSNSEEQLIIQSFTWGQVANKKIIKTQYKTTISDSRITQFEISSNKRKITVQCIL